MDYAPFKLVNSSACMSVHGKGKAQSEIPLSCQTLMVVELFEKVEPF